MEEHGGRPTTRCPRFGCWSPDRNSTAHLKSSEACTPLPFGLLHGPKAKLNFPFVEEKISNPPKKGDCNESPSLNPSPSSCTTVSTPMDEAVLKSPVESKNKDDWRNFRGVRKLLSARYTAAILDPSKNVLSSLGTFDTAEAAARAYDAAAKVYHGPKAKLNFPFVSTPMVSSSRRRLNELGMDLENKDIVSDFLRFVERKKIYLTLRRTWKRVYLLYNPPGIDRSRLIAAMANYLQFRIHNLDGTSFSSLSDIPNMLASIKNRSLIWIQDFAQSATPGMLPDLNTTELRCHCLKEFVRRLWLSRDHDDERIIVFSTNNIDLHEAAQQCLHMFSPYPVALPAVVPILDEGEIVDEGEIMQLYSFEQKPLEHFDATNNGAHQSSVFMPSTEKKNTREASNRRCMTEGVLNVVDPTTKISLKDFDAPDNDANLLRVHQGSPIVLNSEKKHTIEEEAIDFEEIDFEEEEQEEEEQEEEGVGGECLTNRVLSLDDSGKQEPLPDFDATENKGYLFRADHIGSVVSLSENKNRGEALKSNITSIIGLEDLEQHCGDRGDAAAIPHMIPLLTGISSETYQGEGQSMHSTPYANLNPIVFPQHESVNLGNLEDWRASEQECLLEGYVCASINSTVTTCLGPSLSQQPMPTAPYKMCKIPHMMPYLTARQDASFVLMMTTYGGTLTKFQLPLAYGIIELKEEVAMRLKLELDSFDVKYKDEEGDWILIPCDEDLRNYLQLFSSVVNPVIKLLVVNKDANPTNVDPMDKQLAKFGKSAMDPDYVGIISDLLRFLSKKEFYRKEGKAWMRFYLLYEPPASDSSSLIAAMAKHLKFDIFDLDLTSMSSMLDLKYMLLSTTNCSLIVIQDFDHCAGMFPNHKNELTVSCLLKYVDGLFSRCGDERIIVFTTKHRDRFDDPLLPLANMDIYIPAPVPQPAASPDGEAIVQVESFKLLDFDATSNRAERLTFWNITNGMVDQQLGMDAVIISPFRFITMVPSCYAFLLKLRLSFLPLEVYLVSAPVNLTGYCITCQIPLHGSYSKYYKVRAYRSSPLMFNSEKNDAREKLNEECLNKFLLSLGGSTKRKSWSDFAATENKACLSGHAKRILELSRQKHGGTRDDATKSIGAIHTTFSLARKSSKVRETLPTGEQLSDCVPLSSLGRLSLEGSVKEEKSPDLPRVVQIEGVEHTATKFPIYFRGLTVQSASSSCWSSESPDGAPLVLLQPVEQSTIYAAHLARADQCSPAVALPKKEMFGRTLKRKCRFMSTKFEIHQQHFGRACKGSAKNCGATRICRKHGINRVSTVKRIHDPYRIRQWPFRQKWATRKGNSLGHKKPSEVCSLSMDEILGSRFPFMDMSQYARSLPWRLGLGLTRQSASDLPNGGHVLSLFEKKLMRTLKRKCRTMNVLSSEDHQRNADKKWDSTVKSLGAKLICRQFILHRASSVKCTHEQHGIYQRPFQQDRATVKGNSLKGQRPVEVISLSMGWKLVSRLQIIYLSWRVRYSPRPSALPGAGGIGGFIALSSSEFAPTNNRADFTRQDQRGSTPSSSKNSRAREIGNGNGLNLDISLEDLKRHFGRRKRKDAAESLGVSVSTLKRICRRHGINRWRNRIGSHDAGRPPDPPPDPPPDLPQRSTSTTCQRLSSLGHIQVENPVLVHFPEPNEQPIFWDAESSVAGILETPVSNDAWVGNYFDMDSFWSSIPEETREPRGSYGGVFQQTDQPTPSAPPSNGHGPGSSYGFVHACSNPTSTQPISTMSLTTPTTPHMVPPPAPSQDISSVRTVTVKAKYERDFILFQLPLTSGITELEYEVAIRLKLGQGSFKLKYEDDDGDLIWITCNKDLKTYLEPFNLLVNPKIRLFVERNELV